MGITRTGFAALVNALWGTTTNPTTTADRTVNVTQVNGSPPNALIGGRIDANAQVVGDKTGYSLTAGSYSVRASSNQRGTITTTGNPAIGSALISSVTTTRAKEIHNGPTPASNNELCLARITLSGATTVSATGAGDSASGQSATVSWTVEELF